MSEQLTAPPRMSDQACIPPPSMQTIPNPSPLTWWSCFGVPAAIVLALGAWGVLG